MTQEIRHEKVGNWDDSPCVGKQRVTTMGKLVIGVDAHVCANTGLQQRNGAKYYDK